MNDFEEMKKRAIEIRQRYDRFSKDKGFSAWGGKERTMGLVTDVGELMELVMAKENLRQKENVDAQLGHELSDCLWSVIVIAEYYGVDLKAEFHKTMDQLEQRLNEGYGGING